MNARCKGFLLVNAFLRNTKFDDIYERLKGAVTDRGGELDVYTNAEVFTHEAAERLAEDYDYCLFWDKDIRLGRFLESKGIRLMNRPGAVDVCDSKLLTCDAMAGSGVRMPATMALPFTYPGIGYTDTGFLDVFEETFGYPYVLKEARGSFGAQVYLAGDRAEAERILRSFDGRAGLAQEYIKESSGRDLRLNMVGRSMVAAMERYNDNDFRANITAGGSMRPHRVTDEELDIAVKVMEILGLDFAGIDILFSDDGPLLCEVNSNPHFKSIYECTGVDVAGHIADHVFRSVGYEGCDRI